MFSGCTSLEDIVIPESVKTIGSYAFDGRSKITSLEIPNGVEKIEYRAFNRKNRQKSAKIRIKHTKCTFLFKTPIYLHFIPR